MPRFEHLRERLLRAGIAPSHVRRYLKELSDHFDDLLAEEAAHGLPQAAAEMAARARLGNDDALAAVMLARPEWRSVTARFPWAVFGIGPVLMLVLAVAAAVLIEAGLHSLHLAFVRSTGVLHPLPPTWMTLSVAIWNGLTMYAAPLAIAALLYLVGRRQRIPGGWIGLGVGIACFVGGFHQVAVTWTDGDHPGGLSLGFALAPPFPTAMLRTGLVRFAMNVALVTGVYGLCQLRLLSRQKVVA